jgi:HAE1 family hydrophobic/amphiphilic exporter-1
LIGGVITSTVLTLLVIPTFYDVMADWRDWLMRRVRGGAEAPAAPLRDPSPTHARTRTEPA